VTAEHGTQQILAASIADIHFWDSILAANVGSQIPENQNQDSQITIVQTASNDHQHKDGRRWFDRIAFLIGKVVWKANDKQQHGETRVGNRHGDKLLEGSGRLGNWTGLGPHIELQTTNDVSCCNCSSLKVSLQFQDLQHLFDRRDLLRGQKHDMQQWL
jgi:hypothetical protein